ncbi:hypothetical protein ACKWTF_004032 [Chironomus riparius]
MKFKFCGDGDCPDYILAIIHSNLCGLSSIKLKSFSSRVVLLIINDTTVDETEFSNLFDGSVNDFKSAFECIRFLLLSAVRFGVTKDVFSIELQQLGLPREHSLALGKVFDEHFGSIESYLRKDSLYINKLLSSNFVTCDDGIDCVTMKFRLSNSIDGSSETEQTININNTDIPILLKELKIIKAKMDELDYGQ